MSLIPMAGSAVPVRSWGLLRGLATLPSRCRTTLQERLDAQDQRAAGKNWTITCGRWGSRTYRDPLFDLLALETQAGTDAAAQR